MYSICPFNSSFLGRLKVWITSSPRRREKLFAHGENLEKTVCCLFLLLKLCPGNLTSVSTRPPDFFFPPLTSHMLIDKERWWKKPKVTTFSCTPGSSWDAISSDSAGICWEFQASWWDSLVNGHWSLSILRRIRANADSSFCTVPMARSRFSRGEKPGDLRTPPQKL